MPPETPKPGYLVGVVADLGSGRQLQFNTNLTLGATAEDMNAELDKLVGVINRQQARCVLPAMEADLEGARAQRNACAEDIARLNAQSAGGKLSAAERAARDNASVTLGRLDAMVAQKEALLAKTIEQAK